MQVSINVSHLAERLAEEVRARGLADATVDWYRNASRAVARIAEDAGESEWSDSVERKCLERVAGRLTAGELGQKTYVRYVRVLRMMSSLAETGEVDFERSAVVSGRYPISTEAGKAVEGILAHADVTEDARADLRAPVRHLFWYAAKRGVGPMEIDDAVVMDFLVSEVPDSNPGSTGLALRAVVLATEWLRANGNGAVTRDYSRLTLRGGGRRIVPAYTEAELAAIAGAADTSTAKGLRDRAIVLVAFCTGLRGHDVLRIRLADVDWRGQRLVARQSKVRGSITCVLNGETMNSLADYVLNARPECGVPEVFVTVNAPHRPLARGIGGIVESLCERAGVRKLPGRSAHSIRRAFETTLVARGVPLETASEMMGHYGLEHDKEYITYDASASSVVALGLTEAPVTAGAYLGASEGGGAI